MPVQRHHERVSHSVTTEHQPVVVQNRRAAIAVLRRILEGGLTPLHVPGQIQAGRAQVPEVNVDHSVTHQRRGAGIAVLLMDAGPGFRIEDVGDPEQFATPRIQTHRA